MKKLLSLLVLGTLVLSACGKAPEKERFIDATVEVTCMVFQSGDIFDPALEEKTKDVFRDYDFPVDDQEAMVEIAAKYENDEEVKTAVEAALRECASELFQQVGEPEDVDVDVDADTSTEVDMELQDDTELEVDVEAEADAEQQ